MSLSSVIGSFGVALILVAFVLNLMRVFGRTSILYLSLNLVGATVAGVASAMIEFYPFVVLEGVWALAALAGLIRLLLSGRDHTLLE